MGFYEIFGANLNVTDCNPFQLLGYSGTFNPAYLICIEKRLQYLFFQWLTNSSKFL